MLSTFIVSVSQQLCHVGTLRTVGANGMAKFLVLLYSMPLATEKIQTRAKQPIINAHQGGCVAQR